ncbi:MAG: DUF3224 domain-containing protein [Gemmatimonadetes bacterium]|nr:DUF3224 domain-containing protein [Gemmatimonadota bacterium]
MVANGTFEVELTPREDPGFPAGRMLIAKSYEGDMVGSGAGQMISKSIEGGAAAYFAVEEFTGAIEGRTGGFTLLHRGFMSGDTRTLDVEILEGSGSGELAGVSGSMRIIQDESGHRYELVFELQTET